jgi:hypothetical protein
VQKVFKGDLSVGAGLAEVWADPAGNAVKSCLHCNIQ